MFQFPITTVIWKIKKKQNRNNYYFHSTFFEAVKVINKHLLVSQQPGDTLKKQYFFYGKASTPQQLMQYVILCKIFLFFFFKQISYFHSWLLTARSFLGGSLFIYIFYTINYTEFTYFCTHFLQLTPSCTKGYGYESKNMDCTETNTARSSNHTNPPGMQQVINATFQQN